MWRIVSLIRALLTCRFVYLELYVLEPVENLFVMSQGLNNWLVGKAKLSQKYLITIIGLTTQRIPIEYNYEKGNIKVSDIYYVFSIFVDTAFLHSS